METLDELRARVERTLSEMSEVKAGWPDIGMEPRPKVRQQMAEERRVLDERLAAVSRDHASAKKGTAGVDVLRTERARVVGVVNEVRRRAPLERTHGGSEAWNLAADWLSGKVGGEVPGGVIAMRKELGVERLRPLPVLDDLLARTEADLAQHLARLSAELDAWDNRVVRGGIDAELPALESEIVATVRERATTTG